MAPVRVLIAEDEIVLAMGIEKSLKSFGYDVVGKVARGENAIMMAMDKKPDIVLMDIHLEGRIDGIEAAKEIVINPKCVLNETIKLEKDMEKEKEKRLKLEAAMKARLEAEKEKKKKEEEVPEEARKRRGGIPTL